MAIYTSASNQCPSCRFVFRTLEDEFGEHECPRCGYFPREPVICPGCGDEIEPNDEVYRLPDEIVIHAEQQCLLDVVEVSTLEDLMSR